MSKYRLAIFASGSGTNAEAIIKYFAGHPQISTICIFTNNPNAFVLIRAEKLGIPAFVISTAELNDPLFPQKLRSKGISHIILAGFLKLIPPTLIAQYKDRIINIHPALLPDYGGKGMYGMHVHQAVITDGKKESGITIHLVNEVYDEGRILFQAKCDVFPSDTPETLAEKIHVLEHQHFPKVLEEYISSTKFN